VDCKPVDWQEHTRELLSVYKTTKEEKPVKVVVKKENTRPSLVQRVPRFKTKKKREKQSK
jgi:hypothetical protein